MIDVLFAPKTGQGFSEDEVCSSLTFIASFAAPFARFIEI